MLVALNNFLMCPVDYQLISERGTFGGRGSKFDNCCKLLGGCKSKIATGRVHYAISAELGTCGYLTSFL